MKRIIVTVLASALAVACVACVAMKPKNDKMKYVGLKVYDPVYIAMDEGFFEKEGLEIEIVDTVAGGATAVEMVSSGDVQGALLSTMALINAKSSGLPVIGVADIQSSFNNAPLEQFFVREDSGIETVADLKGKNIAINLVKSSFHYTWLMALDNAGLTEDDVNFVQLPFSEQLEALKRGDVDAIGLMSPYIKSAKDTENVTELYNACDVFGERQFCEIFLNEKWAEANSDQAEKFVSAITKAESWAVEHQEDAKKIISKYTGIDAAMIEDYVFQPNAMCVMDDCQFWLDYMKKNEGANPELTVKDIVTNKYNKSVK